MDDDPFTLEPVPEVHLDGAPLAKVLAQVQFSRTPDLVSEGAEQRLAEALPRYPVRREMRGIQFNLTGLVGSASQPMGVPSSPVHIFSDTSGAWQLSATDTAVALETTGYESRDDFCERAAEILGAVASVGVPPVVDRVGLRYITRLSGEHLAQVDGYIVPRLRVMHGGVANPLRLVHSVSDTLIEIGENERMQLRSGLVPPGAGFDPSLPTLADAAWLLDIDVFTVAGGLPFQSEALVERLRRYAEHAYSFFRFATTEAFERAFLHDKQEPRQP